MAFPSMSSSHSQPLAVALDECTRAFLMSRRWRSRGWMRTAFLIND